MPTRPDDPSIHEVVSRMGGRFAIEGTFVAGRPIDTGLINTTWQATYEVSGGNRSRYILQALNDRVFADPAAVMRNVDRVTRHIRDRLRKAGALVPGRTLALVPARDGTMWAADESGVLWRCFEFIEGCVTRDVIETPAAARAVGQAFGSFQNLVSDLDPDSIQETIPDFHHTRYRFDRLRVAAGSDPRARLAGAREEYDALVSREELADALLGPAARGEIPPRIVHNDTKVNNVMIDAVTDEAVCVIDLDTVMPGLAVCDFGDLARSACNSAAEDETDLSKVRFRMTLFEGLAAGYLAAAGGFLTESETGLLVTACRVITFELAVRFLTDHLEGDLYFKTRRPGQNLDRCRNQLHLLRHMERVAPEMEAIVADVRRAR